VPFRSRVSSSVFIDRAGVPSENHPHLQMFPERERERERAAIGLGVPANNGDASLGLPSQPEREMEYLLAAREQLTM